MKLFHLISIFFSLSMVGCNYSAVEYLKRDEDKQFTLSNDKISELSYTLLAQKVFIPKCVSCHGASGNISLENYGDITKYKDLIKKSVFIEKTMPKQGRLSNEELAYLWNWIKMDIPEFPQSGVNEPPVEAEPLKTTFASIDKNVFQVSCKDCHNPIGSGKRIGLDKDSLLNSPLELVIPGNPDESGLIISFERSDDKRMPPSKEGYAALSDQAIAVIRKWIENGAKD